MVYNNKSNIVELNNNLIDINRINNNNIVPQNEKFFILENYLEEYKESKVFDENDVNIIIKGIKEILFHFLAISGPIDNSENV